MAANSNRSRASYFLIRLAKGLGLKPMANFFLKLMPASIQSRIRKLLARYYLDAEWGEAAVLVPVEELKNKQREAVLHLKDTVGLENIGDYLEFGVFNGTSLSCMFQVLQEFGLNQVRLFGFDSFEGLPATDAEEDVGVWDVGGFKCHIEITRERLTRLGIDWNRTFLIKGWFSDTLKPEFCQQHQIQKTNLIMVDCDMYSSTVDVLKFCEPLIQDRAAIFFDDWNSDNLAAKNLGEKKAFDEFLQAHPEFTVEEFGSYHANSNCFIVTRNRSIS